jgi:peptide/nickel transport system substrate-binding protein
MRTRWIVAVLPALSLSGLSIAACGPAQPAEGPAEPSAGRGARPPACDVNPVPRERVRDGGTLRRAIDEFPARWNYHHALGGTAALDDILRGLLPYPFRVDGNGVPHPDPNYVTAARVTATAPRQVVTYTLHRRARWSTGAPVTYRDYAAQAAALSGRDPRFQVGSASGYRQIAKVARGADDFQVVVTFARPYADWPALFSPLYPAAAMSHPAAFNGGRPVATAGPFRMGRIDRTAKSVTIVRDARWWGPRAKLDAMVFRTLGLAAAPGAFANDEIDLIDIGADAAAYRRARSARGAVVRTAAGPDWRLFAFNGGGGVLSDVRVRQAIALGIDRRVLAEAALAGIGRPVQTLDNHFFMNTQEGYADTSAGLGRHDPGRAGRLLDRAGWRHPGPADRPARPGLRQRHGRTLTVRFVIPAAAPLSRQEAELTQAMLGEIGVGVDIRVVPAGDFFARYVSTGNFDITAFSWLGSMLPASSSRSIFVKPRGYDIQQNYSRVGSDRIDRAMDRALRELDPAASRRALNAADRLIWQAMGVLPLYQRPQLIGADARLANEGAHGFHTPVYQDVGFTEQP